jgi:hypothetical protein
MLVPNFSGSCVKDFIVSTLTEEWPLTAKKIYYKLKKNNKARVTYQAVFKALQELAKEGILTKKDMNYEINLSWVNYLGNLADKIKSKYIAKNKIFASSIEVTKVVYNFDPRIMKFLDEIGEKVYNYVKDNEVCILAISGNGYFGTAIKNYLENKGKVVNFTELDRNKLEIYKEDVEKRKVLIVDGAIYTGNTYKKVINKLHKIKNQYDIKEYSYIVEYDMLGLADISSQTKKQPVSLSH